MKNISRNLFFVFFILGLTACSAILGPPGSEPDGPFIHHPQSLPSERLIEGQPNLSIMPVRGGMYVWKTGNSWHVRIAQVYQPSLRYALPPVYSGTIRIDNGVIMNVVHKNVGPANEVRFRMNEMAFRFELRQEREIQGFDFQVQPTGIRHCVSLDFLYNGMPSPDLMFMGSSMYNAGTLPVTVCFD